MNIKDYRSMNEDQLCKDVIIPLLKQMRFQDVTYTHGGAGEQGKDIVCWKRDEIGVRKNYAVVAKAVALTGKAKVAKGTAGEVSMQIQQAFGKDYLDPVSGLPQSINECWVITNQTISKEAEEAIQSSLNPSTLARHVTFINGDKLWELVEKHLVLETVQQRLQELQSIFDSMDSHYRPEVSLLSGSKYKIGFQQKFDGAAQEKPLIIKGRLVFPTTPEGELVKTAFQRHVSTGESISLPPGYFQIEELPDVMKPLIDPEIIQKSIVDISTHSDHHFLAKIEVITDDGHSESIDYVDLKVQKSGRDEITLVNVEKDSLYEMSIVVHLNERKLTINIKWHVENVVANVAKLYRLFNLQLCLSKSFILKLIGLEHQFVVFEQRGSAICSAPPEEFVNMLADLVKIQDKLKKPLVLPVREYSREEVNAIEKLRNVLHEGKIETKWDKFTVTLFNMDKELTETHLNQARSIRISQEETLDFFDQEIFLGIVEYVFRDVIVANKNEVHAALQAYKKDSQIRVDFQAKLGRGRLEILFMDWLPSETLLQEEI